MSVKYFTLDPPRPPRLLRRTDFLDQMFFDGAWEPTKIIVDFLFGQEDNVTGPITGDEARAAVPEAFT